MSYVQNKSWIKDADGNVWASTGDPSKREFYRDVVMHHDFNEEFRLHLIKQEVCSYDVPSKFIVVDNTFNVRDADTGYKV